jgi:hypothetical protein
MKDCKEMAQHIKNANAKIEGEDKRRLVKRNDALEDRWGGFREHGYLRITKLLCLIVW